MPIIATVRSTSDTLRQEIVVNDRFRLVTDEPAELGGEDTAPTPYELLPAALASCIVTTIRMYARRKGWELAEVGVDVELDADAKPQRATIALSLPPGLSDEQVARLEHVAQACPVHRTLERGLVFEHQPALEEGVV
jgi:putative redox protein